MQTEHRRGVIELQVVSTRDHWLAHTPRRSGLTLMTLFSAPSSPSQIHTAGRSFPCGTTPTAVTRSGSLDGFWSAESGSSTSISSSFAFDFSLVLVLVWEVCPLELCPLGPAPEPDADTVGTKLSGLEEKEVEGGTVKLVVGRRVCSCTRRTRKIISPDIPRDAFGSRFDPRRRSTPHHLAPRLPQVSTRSARPLRERRAGACWRRHGRFGTSRARWAWIWRSSSVSTDSHGRYTFPKTRAKKRMKKTE